MDIVEVLRERLQSKDPVEREAAATVAGDEVVEALAPELRAALADPEPGVRRAAARGLAAVHAFRGEDENEEVATAIAGLIAALRDDEDDVKRAAAAALGLVQAGQAAPHLVVALDDPVCTELAEEALVNLGPLAAPVAAELEVVALRGGPGADAAVVVIRELGPGGLPVLGRLLDGSARDRVLDALPAMGIWGASLLRDVWPLALRGGTCGEKAARALVAMGEGAEEALLDVLERAQADVRRAAVEALWDVSLSGVAVRALFDEQPTVRLAALEALARWPERLPAYAGEITLLSDDPDPAVQAAALALLD